MTEVPTKKGPTAIGMAIIGLCILGIIGSFVVILMRGSPKEVTTALHGEKKDYVGSWSTKDGKHSADLKIDASGEISYNESSSLRATRGESGNYEADFLHITAFEGDDIIVGRDLRIKVTSRPHAVGDHLEMTANDLSFVRDR
jgi:hypothetical protein